MMRASGGRDWLSGSYRLGEWEVRPSLNRIRRNGQERLVEPKVMRVLQELAARAPEVVPRTVLLERVWPQEYVTEHVLSRCISELRKALGDEAGSPRYVETIRKGGYRLLQVPQKAPQGREAPTGSGRLPPSKPARMNARRGRFILPVAMAAVLTLAVLLVTRLTNPPQADGPRHSRPLTSYPGSEVDPVLSPDGRQVAFSWDAAKGNFDIYLASLGASSALRLTKHPGEDKNPVFFPDGKRIAFVRSAPGEEGIYAVRWEGAAEGDPAAGEELLIACNTGDIPDLALSPEGRYLYFSDLPEHGRPPSAIYRLDLRTGEKRAVTRPPEYAFGDRDLALSHDGRRLAFARAEVVGVEELFVLDLGNGRSRQLTAENESIAGMTWVPDDSGILFAGSRDMLNPLRLVPADGSAPPRALASLGGQLYDPSISAQTGKLVVEHKEFRSNIWLGRRQDEPAGSKSETQPARLELDGPLAPSTRWDITPAVAPDGRVAFISTRSGYPAVWTWDPADQSLLRLTDASLLPDLPAWSPDGRSLVFSDRSRGQADLIRISSDGGVPKRLTDTACNEVAPTYSRDGSRLYFGSNRNGQWQLLRFSALDTGARTDGKSAEVAASGGAIRGLESPDGRFLYFARHSRPGLWRKPLPDGPEVLVAPGPAAADWWEWTLGQNALHYLQHTGEESFLHSSKLDYDLSSSASALPGPTTSLPIPRRLHRGGGLALAPDGRFYLVGLDRSESDILMIDWPR